MEFRYKDLLRFFEKAENDYFLNKLFTELVLSIRHNDEIEKLEKVAYYLEIYIDKKKKEEFYAKVVKNNLK